MNIKESLYRIITSPLFFYRRKWLPPYCHIGTPPSDWVTDYDEASQIIYNTLEKEEPCMISRFGSVEFMCMENFMKYSHPFWFLRNLWPFWADSSICRKMRENAGFFSSDGYKSYSRFADMLFECGKQADLLACWFKNEKLIESKMHYRKFWILCIEPYWAKKPWSRYLKNKKVLVVHPFAETIILQYKKRELLFDNPDVLPHFASLTVIKAIQSIGGENKGYRDWFEALKSMEDKIDAVDYDVALIGCGAYGMPLAAHCKKMGKKAIHLGGALQLLFGIRGNRWENNYGGDHENIPDYSKLLSNPNWVRPLETEKPKTANRVENACYW